MAQEISYSPQVEPEALPGRAFPRVSDEVAPQAFGAGIARGLEETGDVVQRHVDSVMAQARQTQLTDAHNQLQTLSLSLTHDPQTGAFTKQGKDAFGLDQQYIPQYQEAAQKIVDSVRDPRARQAAQLAAQQVQTHLTEQLESHEIQQHRQFDVKSRRDSVELAQQAAAANYNHPDIIGTNRDGIDKNLTDLAHIQGWSDDQLTEEKYQAHVKLNEGVISNMLGDQKPDMARAYFDSVKGELRPQDVKVFEHAIQSGQVDAQANTILQGYRDDVHIGQKAFTQLEKSGLTPEQQSQVIAKVERGRNELAVERQQDPAVQRQLTALTDSIASGTATLGSLGSVESLWRRGALTDDHRLTMRDQILRSQKKVDAEQEDLAYIRDSYNSRTLLDPKDAKTQRGVNLFVAEQTIGSRPGTPGYNNVAVEAASRLGVVPSASISWARSNLLNGNPQQAAAAAQLLSSLQRAAPGGYDEEVKDKEVTAMADTVGSMTRAGTDPETAVELARENLKRSKAERKLLDEQWNAQRSPGQKWLTLDQHAVRAGLSDDAHYQAPGFHIGNTVPDIPVGMAAEYSDLTHEYFYHTNGNMDQARKLALNDLKSTWGVTQVNGQRELMKYAPERMFPNLTVEDIRHDKAQAGYGAARLVESPETSVTGGRIWSLAEKDEFGAWDVVRDSRGNPVRYQLPQPEKKYDFERELQDYQDKQALRQRQQREEFAAAHPMRQPGF